MKIKAQAHFEVFIVLHGCAFWSGLGSKTNGEIKNKRVQSYIMYVTDVTSLMFVMKFRHHKG